MLSYEPDSNRSKSNPLFSVAGAEGSLGSFTLIMSTNAAQAARAVSLVVDASVLIFGAVRVRLMHGSGASRATAHPRQRVAPATAKYVQLPLEAQTPRGAESSSPQPVRQAAGSRAGNCEGRALPLATYC
jgi:hypothetical protein